MRWRSERAHSNSRSTVSIGGGEYYKKHGRMMPENGRSLIRDHDAILFGSAGHPEIPDHITLWGLRLAICQPFDQYANVRPTRVLPGITSPLRSVKDKELDWVIVRENSEGEYAGVGDRLMRAIERVTADKRFHTPDLGGKAKTADVTAAVIDAIHGANA